MNLLNQTAQHIANLMLGEISDFRVKIGDETVIAPGKQIRIRNINRIAERPVSVRVYGFSPMAKWLRSFLRPREEPVTRAQG